MATTPDPISHEPPAKPKSSLLNPEVQGAANLTSDDYDFTPAEYEDEKVEVERKTVLHGYGRLHPAKRHYIDEVEFVGGVAIHVPLTTVERWQKAGSVRIKVLPDSTARLLEEVSAQERMSWAKAIGLKPMNSDKLAALLSAADYDQLVQALGVTRTEQLMTELEKRLKQKASR